MTILSLALFRRNKKKSRSADPLESESAAEASTRVLSRLERLLMEGPLPAEETPVTARSPGEFASAHPRNDGLAADSSSESESMAFEDLSAVSVMAPPEDVEAEPPSAPAPPDNDTTSALVSLGLEPETSQVSVEARLMAALDDARAEREARRLAKQESDHAQHQVGRVEAQLAEAIGKFQNEAVLRRAAEIELERAQEEGSRRVMDMEARLDGLLADLSKATQTTTTATVKMRARSARATTAPKSAAAARKTRAVTKAVAAPKLKTAKTSVAGTARTSTAAGTPRKNRAATKTAAARESKTVHARASKKAKTPAGRPARSTAKKAPTARRR